MKARTPEDMDPQERREWLAWLARCQEEVDNITEDDKAHLQCAPPESKAPYNPWPPVMPWGKHKKKKLSMIPSKYLIWAQGKLERDRNFRRTDKDEVFEPIQLETDVVNELKSRGRYEQNDTRHEDH